MSIVFKQEEDAAGGNGIMTTAHPAVLLPVQLADKTAQLPAGTVLKQSASGGTYEAAADSDTPVCVLVEKSDGTTGLQMAAFHGVAVRARLVNASGDEPEAASDTLAGKLPAVGIWLAQSFAGEVK